MLTTIMIRLTGNSFKKDLVKSNHLANPHNTP
jgi:hypothetical protein